jgi:hypothetical protein
MHQKEKGGKIFFEEFDSQENQIIRRRDHGI